MACSVRPVALRFCLHLLHPTCTRRRNLQLRCPPLIVPFKIAFNQPPVPHSDPPTPSQEVLDQTPPLIQISLPGDSSPGTAQKLGKVLGELRKDGWGVVCTGQAVHNLRDLRGSFLSLLNWIESGSFGFRLRLIRCS